MGLLRSFGSLVRFSHTVFALPFAVMGAFLAEGGVPGVRTILLIILAMVSARTAAMAMNRLVDRRIDALNPRTSKREMPAGNLSVRQVLPLLLASAVVFVLACAMLNPLTLFLSPVVLAVLLSYPYAKRFTTFCHLWLGVGLGLSPIGAWVAVRGAFGQESLCVALLGAAVVLWTAGFDVIYALLDLEFDREQGLFSLPARLGARGALTVSALFHLGTVGLLVAAGVVAGLSWVWFAGVAGAAGLLFVEHWIVRPSDLSRLGTAFFTVNGVMSVVLMLFLVTDVLVS